MAVTVISALSNPIKTFGPGGEWELRNWAYYIFFGHVMGLQGLYFILTGQVPWQHLLFVHVLFYASWFAIFVGAHRLWSHRSFKAKKPLHLFLTFLATLSGQGSIIYWVKDHRLHHKFCETDSDPYNVVRGAFYAHIGWQLLKEHPDVTNKRKRLDYSDVENDPILAFQHKYYQLSQVIFYHIIPILIPYYFWLPSLYICICLNYWRYVISLLVAGFANSWVHTWTRKPYEKSFGAADVSLVSFLMLGEGWHNFHHVFPWDYRSTDIGLYAINGCTVFIDLMAKLGLAYDLKTVPDELVRKRVARTGDGSHPDAPNNSATNESAEASEKIVKTASLKVDENFNKIHDLGDIRPGPWGWGDPDIAQEDTQGTLVTNCNYKER